MESFVNQPSSQSVRTKSLSKPRIPDGSPSTRKILGVYNVGTKTSVPQNPIPPKPPLAIRFVCLSDTHCRPVESVPEGDVLLHAGDFSMTGTVVQVRSFNNFLGTLPHKHKIVIAGNHDVTFHEDFYDEKWRSFHKTKEISDFKKLLTNCTYIEDEMVVVEGIRIWGSPWQPEFCDWAFNLQRGLELKEMWDLIPVGADIIMTHGPVHRFVDKTRSLESAGCEDLAEAVKRVKPIVHISGHIHEAYGHVNSGNQHFINASICTIRYQPENLPIVFDLE